ncbi:MAG: flagellin [Lachnospiraceae bacterium]
MRINTNISAIIANAQLTTTEEKLSKSLERLSSGYKINHSKDNPAGLAISQKMQSQIRGLDQADNNAQDGISVLQTAEGAMTEIQSMLARMKELSVQAANDVNSVEDRGAIQEELDALTKEIDRISEDTDFNTKSLLAGDLERRVYSNVRGVKQMEVTDGFREGSYVLQLTKDAEQAKLFGSTMDLANTGVISESQAGTVSFNGLDVVIEAGETYGDVMAKVMDGVSKAGGTMKINNQKLEFTSNTYGSNETFTIRCTDDGLIEALGLYQIRNNDGDVVYPNADGNMIATGKDCEVTLGDGFSDTAVVSTYGNEITVRDNNDRTFILKVPGGLVQENGGAVDIKQDVTDIGTLRVHIGANENQIIDVNLPEVSTETLGLQDLNVYTYSNASKAIEAVDQAVTKLSTMRSKIGAYQNRLEHTTSNLAVSNENLTAALSRIMDVDMAEEMTEYTQMNVLAQAGTSMLSQANARPETALQLLQS